MLATLSHGPRFCGLDNVVDIVDPFFFKMQTSATPITQANPSQGGQAGAIACDPASPTCRHLRSLLDQAIQTDKSAGTTSQPFSLPDLSGQLAQPPLNLNLNLYDIEVPTQFALFGQVTNVTRRPRTTFSAQDVLPADGTWG